LIGALKEHGVTGINYFFGKKGLFHFGTKDDTRQNGGNFQFLNRKRTTARPRRLD
jgi:hypothetical protein